MLGEGVVVGIKLLGRLADEIKGQSATSGPNAVSRQVTVCLQQNSLFVSRISNCLPQFHPLLPHVYNPRLDALLVHWIRGRDVHV